MQKLLTDRFGLTVTETFRVGSGRSGEAVEERE